MRYMEKAMTISAREQHIKTKISRDEHIHSPRLCLSMRFLILIHPRVRPR